MLDVRALLALPAGGAAMSYARRTDANHGPVIGALRACGWYVLDTSRVPGFVDVIAARRGRIVFCEIKDGAKWASARKLTEAQRLLHADLRAAGAEVAVIETPEQAVRL